MNDCIFCRIIKGDIPSAKVYEDDMVYAFLDISQITEGHTLLIPKTHVENIFEYNEDLIGELAQRIPKISNALQKAFPEIQGLNIVNNNGEVAYQSVFHSHFHLIPRYKEDEGFAMKFADNSEKYNNNHLQEIAKKINNNLN